MLRDSVFSDESQRESVSNLNMSRNKIIHELSREFSQVSDSGLRYGIGTGSKCSGGWTSDNSLARLSRLEKLQALAIPDM